VNARYFKLTRPFLLVLVLALCTHAAALDREAWTITRYDLDATVTPASSSFSSEGTLRLRNVSKQPQKNVVLQISSSLNWDSVALTNDEVQWLAQPYESDIDHTGRLSEAIITLPEAIAPSGTIDLHVRYSGVIKADAARLVRVGMPENVAVSADWDQIGEQFTAVRGVGYVAWYPVAIEAATLSEGSALFDAIARWQERSCESTLTVSFKKIANLTLLSNGQPHEGASPTQTHVSFQSLDTNVPAFTYGAFEVLDRPAMTVYFLPQHSSSARDWALAIEQIAPTISQWFGPPKQKVQVIDLGQERASSFEEGPFLFAPLRAASQQAIALETAPTLVHAAVSSNRHWIGEGLGQFAQMLLLEKNAGRSQVLAHFSRLSKALAQAEQQQSKASDSSTSGASQSLISSADPAFYRTKAMFVWWMLRDMLGDEVLQHAITSYRAADDKEPSYIQGLLEVQAKRSLEAFFGDWVYRDNGLPDFKVESVYPRKTLNNSYVVTVTVANSGRAGAEIPVTVRAERGARTARLFVPATQKATVRVEIAAYPTDVEINDGSVPESDATNNTFTVVAPAS
jgi:hypothetical protein